MENKTQKAFTIAEVLIVLGIIGVIAALTIPSLLHTYKKKLIETRLLAAYTMLNQLQKASEQDNGSAAYWADAGTPLTSEYVVVLMSKYVLPYLKTAEVCQYPATTRKCATDAYEYSTKELITNYFGNGYDYTEGKRKTLKINLANGISFNYIPYPINAQGRIGEIRLDLNISKDKMYQGVDYFEFLPTVDSKNVTAVTAAKISNSDFYPYVPSCSFINSESKRDLVSKACTNYQKNGDGTGGYWNVYCSAIIQCNGWKIPDWYPINF